jgi:DNA invertase Pin-like site-specific DNA recombinase
MSKGEIVGYARVSSEDQDLTIQIEALRDAGCTKIFSEKVSGSSTKGRYQLAACINYMRDGDVMVITRLDRLARSVTDLNNIVTQLRNDGIGFKSTEQAIDTTTSTGRLMFNMLGAFAEFELDIRKERQAEGIAKAKAKGVYKGRTKTDEKTVALIIELSTQRMTRKEVAAVAGVGVATVYKVIKQYKESV